MSRRPVPFRGGGFRPLAQPLVGLAAFVVLIAGWQAAASLGLIATLLMPAPFEIGQALVNGNGFLWRITPGHLRTDLVAIDFHFAVECRAVVGGETSSSSKVA